MHFLSITLPGEEGTMMNWPLPLLLLSWVEMQPSGETHPLPLLSQQLWC